MLTRNTQQPAQNSRLAVWARIRMKIRDFYQNLLRIRQAYTIKTADKINFADNLSTMLGAGLGIVISLEILREETEKKIFRKIIMQVEENVQSGETLSKSLAQFPHVFPLMLTSMVRVGELSGRLADTLRDVAEEMLREDELSSKVKGALIYPFIVVTVMAVVGVLTVVFVMPRVIELFKDLETELPWMTKVIISVFETAQSVVGAYFLLAVLLIVLIGFRLVRTKAGRMRFDQAILFVPGFGVLLRQVALNRFCRSLGTLLKSGVPILESLHIVGNASTNQYYRQAVEETVAYIEQGSSLNEALKQSPHHFPAVMVKMVHVSEETGMLDVSLEKLAQFYQRKIDNMAHTLTTLIEPMLMIAMGLAVGVLAMGILAPIYDLVGKIE